MPRKPPKSRQGGYRHGVPGGRSEKFEIRATPQELDAWRADATAAGFTGERNLTPYVRFLLESAHESRVAADSSRKSDTNEK